MDVTARRARPSLARPPTGTARPGLLAVVLSTVALAAPARAHVGGLGGAVEANPVPVWLVALTGGGVVGVSFLFTSLVTDREAIRAAHARRMAVSLLPGTAALRTAAAAAGGAVGLAALGTVLVVGWFGPPEPVRNFAVLFVWVGWWAGYTMSVYLVGNGWPALNPWRRLAAGAERLGGRHRGAGRHTAGVLADATRARASATLRRWDPWPSVVGLLALVWVEVVAPAAEEPRALVALVVAYTAATLAGAVLVGPGVWFGRVDPVSRVFALYGRAAPVARGEGGLGLSLPGARLVADPGRDESPFVVALLWVTSFDGLVATAAWNDLARPAVAAGVPPLALSLAALLAGYGLFLWAYRAAAARVRRSADSYVAAAVIRRRFAPPLVPIAAGYHLAHYLGYVLALAPTLATLAGAPLSPPADVPVLVLPGWFSSLQLGFVLVGHVLAVWVAHSVAFELFTGRLQPIRSQYPLVVVMIAYTAASLWIVSQPFAPGPAS